jgi:alkanesulfonate monooxygenase SsuD/methylene tetrahydromethanopterin reductase-like flavin-dependent oxidoreductase (luciferase family)
MSVRGKKIGILLPQKEREMAGETARGPQIVELGRRAQEAGLDSVWLVDHFAYEPYADEAAWGHAYPQEWKGVMVGFWECWTLASALAAATERVEIGTLVANTGYRNPGLLASMANSVDELSQGRLVLGVGAGDFRSEHEAFGYPWERRVGRFEEALQIIRPLLAGEHVTFDGEHYRTRNAVLLPRGPRPEGPPILIGLLEGGPRMRRLVAQYADHWNCWLVGGRAYRDSYEPVMAACERHGRDPATLVKNAAIGIRLPGHGVDAADMSPWEGSPDELADRLGRFLEEDVDHVVVWLDPATPAGVESLAGVLERIG